MIIMKKGLKTSENEKEEAAEIIRYKKGRGSEGNNKGEKERPASPRASFAR